jgi:hypothetical protein
MEFTSEFIEANGLSEDQVTAINSHVQSEIVPGLKKGYDTEYSGRANENAESILDGVGKHAKTKLGVDFDRERGEKIADYLTRALDSKFTSKEAEFASKEAEYQEKLDNFKGGDQYKAELDKIKAEKDGLLKQVAELEPLKGYDEKYNNATQEMGKLKREVAYGSVKPSFPEGVNKFEADARWNAFKGGIEEKYNIELVDGKPIAIDKENEHKRYDLETLVSQDENITELLKGRQQRGTGASSVDMREVEGVPFKIPANATSEDISKLVREHVQAELGSFTHKDFSSKFADLYKKAKQSQ